jgi:hypothetical protein
MHAFLFVLLLALTGCSSGSDPGGSQGGGGHPFEDRGAGGSGGAGGGSGGSEATTASSGSGGSDASGGGSSSSTGPGAGGAGGGCGDTMTDPENCGACGRSCLGASCSFGLCESKLIASGTATSLAVSSQAVVWGTANGARAAALDGSLPHAVALGVTGAVPAVAGNADSTAFVVGTSVLVFDAAASTMTINQLATSPVALAADTGHVYWADGNGHAGLYQLDTTSRAVVEVAYPSPPPVALTVGDGLVCWTAFTSIADGALRCVPSTATGTGAGTALKQDLRDPCAVAVAAGEAFWAECPEGQDATVSEVSDQDGSGFMGLSSMAAAAVATDGVYAYWADHDVFRRIEIASGTIESRGVAPSQVNHLVAGSDRLYWSNSSGVHWVAK